MSNNILNKIINKKAQRLSELKKTISIESLKEKIDQNTNYLDFKKKIENNIANDKISLIAEIKKASPSAGEIIKNFDPLNIAKIYVENGASSLSVLTEEDFFMGKLDYIKNIKNNFNIPILCKDFFIDTYQIALAKSFGADCILIILSAVDKMLAKDLYQASLDLNINSLVEVHTKSEAEFALSFENSLTFKIVNC